MKRTFRAGHVAIASAVALALALTHNAAAQTQVATADMASGSSESPAADSGTGGVAEALTGLAQSLNGVLNEGVVPTVEYGADQVNIVLDPSTIAGLAAAFAPSHAGQLSTSMTGQTADGHKVVFPTSGTFTSGYGMRWGAMHNGIDVGNSVGTPIVSVMDGTVLESGPAQGFGNWIRIQHDNGAISVYGHMQASSLLVSPGQRVTAGQQIAAIGNEGQSTGPHLHFEIWPDGTSPSDPQAWFAQQGIVF